MVAEHKVKTCHYIYTTMHFVVCGGSWLFSVARVLVPQCEELSGVKTDSCCHVCVCAEALHLVSTAANHVNETMKTTDKFKQLLEVQERISGVVDLVSPTRELLKEGKTVKISARSGDHQERYLFLVSISTCISHRQLDRLKHKYLAGSLCFIQQLSSKVDQTGWKCINWNQFSHKNQFPSFIYQSDIKIQILLFCTYVNSKDTQNERLVTWRLVSNATNQPLRRLNDRGIILNHWTFRSWWLWW